MLQATLTVGGNPYEISYPAGLPLEAVAQEFCVRNAAAFGITTNEPDLLALRQAVEKAVEMLVVEGAELGVWSFGDKAAGNAVLEKHRKESGGVFAARTTAGKNGAPAQSAQIAPPPSAAKGS